jgi:ABC-type Fe3+-siderophore transport system permease subunit
LAVAGGLAALGAAYQSLFRNPLVSPDILGVSSGAAFGAVIGIFLSLHVLAIEAVSFIGGLMAVLIVYVSLRQSAGATRCWCWSLPASSSAQCSAPGSAC